MKISKKLILAFGILIMILIVEVVLNQVVSNQAQSTYEKLKSEIEPAVKTLNQYESINKELYLLALNRINKSIDGQNRISGILDVELPYLKTEIFLIQESFSGNDPRIENARKISNITEEIILIYKQVDQLLLTKRDYIDSLKLIKARNIVENDIANLTYALEIELAKLKLGYTSQYDIHQNELSENLQAISKIILITGLIGIIISLIIATQVINSIVRPISLLLNATSQISSGDYSQEIAIKNNDEFGQLSDAFNKMSSSIRESFEKIKSSNAELSRLYNSDIIGVIKVDFSGNFLLANDAFLNTIQYTREDFESNKIKWTELTPPEWESKDEEAIKQLTETGVAIPWEKEYYRKDGSKVPILVGVAMIEGTEDQCVCFILDITEQKKVQHKLEASNKDLEQFAYIATHDIKSPIANIESFLNFLKEDEDIKKDRSKQSIDWIEKSVEKAKQTIQDLVLVTRSRNETDIEVEEVNINEMLEDAKNNLQAEIQISDAIIETDFGGGEVIVSNKVKMKSLILNLMSNAIKYRSEDRQPKVMLTTKKVKGYTRLSVQDNGLGIDLKKDKEKVFGLFKRANNKVSGSGIGLYMTKQSIENMGGKIEVESEVDKGTAFHVYFKDQVNA